MDVVIKQALLKHEIDKITQFLMRFDLKYDRDITETLFIEEADEVIATISRTGHIIKALAVHEDFRGENIAGILLTEMLMSMRSEDIFYYQVYTKTTYAPIFSSMSFRLLARTDHVAILESGESHIDEKIGLLRRSIENHFSISLNDHDLGCIVVNCNPMTKGHYQLIVDSAKHHAYFIVLVVEEDQSAFTFAERFFLVEKALQDYPNIVVLPSTNYIVSQLTFPSYFLKNLDEAEREHAKLDAIIFREYFLPGLHISKRYIGTETEAVMVAYNQILIDTMKDHMVQRERYTYEDQVISASRVRALLHEGRITEAKALIPDVIQEAFVEIVRRSHAFGR